MRRADALAAAARTTTAWVAAALAAGPPVAAALAAAGLASLSGCVGQHATPVPPPQLRLQCATATVVGLQWSPVPGLRYRVFRDGALLGAAPDAEYADITVAASRTYRYEVEAQSRHSTATAALSVATTAALPTGDAPYCASAHMRLHWDFEHASRAAPGSDLWPATWGRDGRIYLFFGDGGGFGGDDHRGRTSFGIAVLAGPPPPTDSAANNLYGGFRGRYPASISGKARALLAIGDDYFALAGIYKPGDARATEPQPISGSPDHVELVYSRRDAHSWQSSPWIFCSSAAGSFCPSGFVNYGPGGSGLPGYVYLYGSSRDADRRLGDAAAHTYLARVRPRRLLRRRAYGYFAGIDAAGKPRWDSDPRQMAAVFTDRSAPRAGCGGRCNLAAPLEEAVYNQGLKRYIAMAQGDYLAQTAFYEAPTPWGPWHTLSYDNIDPATGGGGWGNLGTAGGSSLGVHAVNAWTSTDGLTMWMTFSSDGIAPDGAKFPPPGTKLDALQLVRVNLETGGPR